jgi:hypothetical protein
MIGPRCQPVPTPPAPAGWTRQELAELDDPELLGIAGSLPRFGQQLGISQIQVSRLLGRALGYLRPRLLGLDEAILR